MEHMVRRVALSLVPGCPQSQPICGVYKGHGAASMHSSQALARTNQLRAQGTQLQVQSLP